MPTQILSGIDWFSEMIPAWTRFLVPALTEVMEKEARSPTVLLLGCHEARSALWLLESAFRADGRRWPARSASPPLSCHVTVVEPFDYARPDRTKPVPAPERRRLMDNLGPYVVRGDARVIVDRSYADVLTSSVQEAVYDAVAIDARGNSRDALQTMVLAWPHVRRGGGVMIVSNYTFSKEHDARCPRRGIDAFMDAYSDDLRVLATQWHVFIARLRVPRVVPGCASEYFPNDHEVPVVIYTVPGCRFCLQAKALLTSQGYQYQEVDVQGDPVRREALRVACGGATSVPQIFIDGVHVGGCDELHARLLGPSERPVLRGAKDAGKVTVGRGQQVGHRSHRVHVAKPALKGRALGVKAAA